MPGLRSRRLAGRPSPHERLSSVCCFRCLRRRLGCSGWPASADGRPGRPRHWRWGWRRSGLCGWASTRPLPCGGHGLSPSQSGWGRRCSPGGRQRGEKLRRGCVGHRSKHPVSFWLTVIIVLAGGYLPAALIHHGLRGRHRDLHGVDASGHPQRHPLGLCAGLHLPAQYDTGPALSFQIDRRGLPSLLLARLSGAVDRCHRGCLSAFHVAPAGPDL